MCQPKRVSWTNSLPCTVTGPPDTNTHTVSVCPGAGADGPPTDTETNGRSPEPVERRPTWRERLPSRATAPLLPRLET
jgi:hypothetical protein